MLASEREQQKAKEASEKALQKAEEELRQLQAKLNDLEYAQRRQIHSGRFSRGGFDSSRLGFKRSLEDGDGEISPVCPERTDPASLVLLFRAVRKSSALASH